MPKLTDLYFQADRIWFTWIPSHEEGFADDLAYIKHKLAQYGRRWSPERKEWYISNTEDGAKAIELVFDNGTSMLRNVRNQMDLFTRG
jgi:hypothetical protein